MNKQKKQQGKIMLRKLSIVSFLDLLKAAYSYGKSDCWADCFLRVWAKTAKVQSPFVLLGTDKRLRFEDWSGRGD